MGLFDLFKSKKRRELEYFELKYYYLIIKLNLLQSVF